MRSFRKWLGWRSSILIIVALAGSGSTVLALLPSVAYAAIPPHPAFKSSAPFGIWDNGGFDVYNNEWNTSQAGPQTIWANSFRHWGVVSTQASTTSVKTYPSVQKNYNNRPYTSLKGLTSTFTQSMPSASDFDAEAAYDIFFNGISVEVMVWVDNHGQTPAGAVIARVKIYGQKFAVWSSGHNMYSFVLSGKQEKTGKVHLLTALRWLVNHGDISKSDTLTQVDFGWEICSTHGVPMDFTVENYSLSTSWKS